MSFHSIHSDKSSPRPTYYRDPDDNSPRGAHPESVMYTRDWRTALRTPPTYRIGNRTLRFNFHTLTMAMLVAGVCAFFVVFFYVRSGSTSYADAAWLKNYASSTSSRSSFAHSDTILNIAVDVAEYNTRYPLTKPIMNRGGAVWYRIAMVADMDTNSKLVKEDGSTVWRSYLKEGYLKFIEQKQELIVTWDVGEPIALESSYAYKGRGMELSELVTFNGKLLSVDDRTGLVYIIEKDKAIPWTIMLDGDGNNAKGFKAEWATVKDDLLFVGSMGKEWTTAAGTFENENPMFVKVITPAGQVRSLDWSFNYKLLRQNALQITWPGYMIHESCEWSERHKKWYFLPRRCSAKSYNETSDEHMGCNVLISADEFFTKVETVNLAADNTSPTHGFSSFKFVPGTDDHIILAIKTEELNGKTATFITAFDVTGKTLLPEQKIDTDLKYEGLEFI